MAENSAIDIDASNGPVIIFVKEQFSLSNTKFNVSGNPADVVIYCAYDNSMACTVNIADNSQCRFLMAGRKSAMTISGSQVEGAVVGSRMTVDSGSKVTYPHDMITVGKRPVIISWEEK